MLPTLKQQGVRVFILSEACDVEGIETLSDKVRQASDESVSPQLRAGIHIKSPGFYIYTSGTTGDLYFYQHLLFTVLALSERNKAVKKMLLLPFISMLSLSRASQGSYS